LSVVKAETRHLIPQQRPEAVAVVQVLAVLVVTQLQAVPAVAVGRLILVQLQTERLETKADTLLSKAMPVVTEL
jgi:hypothetical protein